MAKTGKGKEKVSQSEEIASAEFEQSKAPNALKKAVSPNNELDLAGFIYENLTGDSFQSYVRLAGDHSVTEVVEGKDVPIRGTLQENKAYDFVLLKAKPVMQARFPGMEKTPYDYVGIKAEGQPLHTTRMPLKAALEYNRQILNAHSRAGHGKYYFLKKV